VGPRYVGNDADHGVSGVSLATIAILHTRWK
jgi:hypothetical protein